MEVAGRLTLVIDKPATSLQGAAACDVPANSRQIAGVRANNVGTVGGHRVFVTLNLVGGEPGQVHVSLGQGMENLPPDSRLPEHAGWVGPDGVRSDADGRSGSVLFTGLPVADGPFVGVTWPKAIAGRVEWSCDPIPDDPTPSPPGATGGATLGGAISGTFTFQAADCPTPGVPAGFLSGRGTIDGRDAILEITFGGSDGVYFVLYRTPRDKNDIVVGKGPAEIRAMGAGGSWSVHLDATSEGIGPITLDGNWTCGG